MNTTPHTTLVIFGISGDLARRKILPPLITLFKENKLPTHFTLLGITRQDISLETIFSNIHGNTNTQELENIKTHCELLRMDTSKQEEFKILATKLESLAGSSPESQSLFYFSVPPHSLETLLVHLGETRPHSQQIKILLEKPLGTDEASAKTLIRHIEKYFTEEEIYHIDHYLAKQLIYSLPFWKKEYPLFEEILNNKHISHIEVVSLESINIEGRADFYDKTGALRDIIQSHLLEVLAQLIQSTQGRSEVLESLFSKDEAQRAQYKGYREETGNRESTTETFAEVTLYSTIQKWHGVPFILTTGKALKNKKSGIHIKLNDGGEIQFSLHPTPKIEYSHIQSEGLSSVLAHMKADLQKQEQYNEHERIILTAIAGNKSIFLKDMDIITSWKLIDPIIHVWEKSNKEIPLYKKGSSLEEIRNAYEYTQNK